MVKPTQPQGKVRMEEVARVAGVSLATVSRVLRHPQKVSAPMRARVQDAATRLGYAPDPVAGSLAGARSPLVGVIVPSLTNAFFSGTLEAMGTRLEARGLQMMIGCHDYDPAREDRLVAAYAGWRPSALVVTGTHLGRGALATLSRADCPVISMWDTDGTAFDSRIGFSQIRAGQMTAEVLARKGHRHVAFAGAVLKRDSRARARAQALAARFETLTGQEVPILDLPGRELGQGGAVLDRLAEEAPATTAIAFSGDMLAAGALFEAQRRGLRVPDDLALLGYGDLEIAGYTNPGLATIRPPSREIGAAVADHVLARLDGAEGGIVTDLPIDIMERGSL